MKIELDENKKEISATAFIGVPLATVVALALTKLLGLDSMSWATVLIPAEVYAVWCIIRVVHAALKIK